MSLSDIDFEIEALRTRLESRENAFAELDAELVDLRNELAQFERDYNNKVRWVENEIKKLDEEILRLERQRTVNLYGDPDPHANWRFGWKPPEDYVNASEQFRRARTPAPPQTGGLMGRIKGGSAATVDETAVKKLYRQLARRFHPDLAETEADRAYRTQIMGQVNEAYTARSLSELKAFLDVPDRAPAQPVQQEPPAHIRLKQLQALYDELGAKIAALQREREQLMSSPLMDLKLDDRLARKQGRNLLDEIAADVRRELKEKQQRVEQLRRALH